jgi:hypothetical protein
MLYDRRYTRANGVKVSLRMAVTGGFFERVRGVKHPQEILTRHLGQFFVAPAATCQLFQQRWEPGIVFQPGDGIVDAVEVASQADVVDPGDIGPAVIRTPAPPTLC